MNPELLATALVGTDRRSSTMDDRRDPAAAVLDRAAGWAVARRAGVRSIDGVARPDPAGPETRPMVPDAAARRLADLLDGGVRFDASLRAELLEEWLAIAQHRGARVPPPLLPELLQHGRLRTGLRPAIVAVGGARIQWLAEQNPDWRYLTRVESTSDDQLAWSDGTPGQRVGYLRALRERDPAAARELLDGEWRTLSAPERAELVSTLEVSLSLADEDLLERALDDRGRDVREVGGQLLARLPGSAYAGRMLDRTRACLSFRDGAVAQVDPPVVCDPPMRRDGIAPRPPTGAGERAWWLEEILARIPLPALPMPLPLVDAAVDWAPTIHKGLARAAAAYRDPAWAGLLLDQLGTTPAERALAAALYPVLTPEQVVSRAMAALEAGDTPAWGGLLAGCPAPWPDPLAQAALAGLETLARPESIGDLQRLSRLAAVRMPATMVEPVEATVARLDAIIAEKKTTAEKTATAEKTTSAAKTPASARTAATFETLAAILRYRYEMTEEIV